VNETKIRIGVVGFDHWYTAISFAQRLVGHADAELAGIADPDPDRAGQVGERVGRPDLVVRVADLIADRSVDAIASFVNSERNPEICIAAAGEGKHLLSIKPMARTLEQADRVAAAVARSGVVFLPAESRARLAPQNQRLKEWFAEGRFGRIISSYATLWASLPQRWPGDPDPGWFADPALTVGGAWIDHSIYQLDLLRWLSGHEVASVKGHAATLTHPGLRVEDYGVATVIFDDGAVATIEDTWTCPPGASRAMTTVVGTEGAFTYDRGQGRLSVSGNFPPLTGWIQVAAAGAQADAIDHFAGLIRGDAEPVATVEDGRRNLAACLAFYESAARGVAVEPVGSQENRVGGAV
jgi:predicted dehydrogenase